MSTGRHSRRGAILAVGVVTQLSALLTVWALTSWDYLGSGRWWELYVDGGAGYVFLSNEQYNRIDLVRSVALVAPPVLVAGLIALGLLLARNRRAR